MHFYNNVQCEKIHNIMRYIYIYFLFFDEDEKITAIDIIQSVQFLFPTHRKCDDENRG